MKPNGYTILEDFSDRPSHPTRHYQQPVRRLPVMPILVLLILIALLAAANLSAVIYLILNQ